MNHIRKTQSSDSERTGLMTAKSSQQPRFPELAWIQLCIINHRKLLPLMLPPSRISLFHANQKQHISPVNSHRKKKSNSKSITLKPNLNLCYPKQRYSIPKQAVLVCARSLNLRFCGRWERETDIPKGGPRPESTTPVRAARGRASPTNHPWENSRSAQASGKPGWSAAAEKTRGFRHVGRSLGKQDYYFIVKYNSHFTP